MNKVSAVIPTYNQKKYVLRAINSLLKQTTALFEIIVIDNASTDGTYNALIKEYSRNKKVTVLKSPTNTGVTGGRNMGLKSARGDVILFFDHDMEADQNMLSDLLSIYKIDKKIGIVTPKIYYKEKGNIIWSAGTDINLWTGQVLFRGGEDIGQYEKILEVAVAPAVILVKKKVIDKIGVFDDIFTTSYEDTDFCFRARKSGFKTYYCPTAIGHHNIPYDEKLSQKRLLSRSYYVGRNRVVFMKRYGKSFFIFSLFLPVFSLYYLWIGIRNSDLASFANYVRGIRAGLFRNK